METKVAGGLLLLSSEAGRGGSGATRGRHPKRSLARGLFKNRKGENKMKTFKVMFLLVFALASAVICAAQETDLNAALLKAAKKRDLASVKALLSMGADVNAKDKDCITPLIGAAVRGHKDFCKLLISKGAEINAKDKDGWITLKFAIGFRENDVADFLRSKEAKE